MPPGIIMQSGSVGATQEAIEKVLTANGYEPEKPEPAAAEEEPARDAFDSEEAFNEAHEAWTAKQEESEEHEEEEEDPKPAAQKLTRRQKAVNKATRELQEQVRSLKDEIATLRRNPAASAEPALPKLEEPKRDKFQTDKEFEDALFDYRYKLRRQKEDTEAAITAQNQRAKDNYENYRSNVAEFRDALPEDDWDATVNQNIPVHESVQLAIIEQENGAQVTYYLGKHPEYARKLAEMSPLSAVMEIGRLAERLKKGAPQPRTTQSGTQTRTNKPRVPEPVKPVSTAASSSTLTSREAAANRDFRAFKRAQAQGR